MNLDALRQNYDRLNAALPENGTFDGPTLFVRGGTSDYVEDEDLPEIRERFPTAELVTIEEAGHWVHAEAPDAFAEVVVDFLEG
jgi:pimeloyl-ACP methyl ester carboxylesterase